MIRRALRVLAAIGKFSFSCGRRLVRFPDGSLHRAVDREWLRARAERRARRQARKHALREKQKREEARRAKATNPERAYR